MRQQTERPATYWLRRRIIATLDAGSLEAHRQELGQIGDELRRAMVDSLAHAASRAAQAEAARLNGPWAEDVRLAVEDDALYQAELSALGVSPEQYNALREELSAADAALADLVRLQRDIAQALMAQTTAWEDRRPSTLPDVGERAI